MNCATTHPDFVIPVMATKSRCLKCWLVFAPMTPNPGFAVSGAKKKGPAILTDYREGSWSTPGVSRRVDSEG